MRIILAAVADATGYGGPVLVMTRYVVPTEDAAEFRALAVPALTVLTGQTGCTSGHLGRNVDDPTLWTLTTTWRTVGDYRRALSAYDVKLNAVPLMYRAIDEPTAYEDLQTWTPERGLLAHTSDRAEGTRE